MRRTRIAKAAGLTAAALLVAAGVQTLRVRRGIAASTAAVPGRSDYWREAHHGEGELLYAALGDSAGQSIGTEDPLAGYVGEIARRYARATGRTVAVANLSVSGARTRHVVRDQLPALAALDRAPDLVTCVIGGNDIYFGTPEEEFVAAYEQMLAGLPEGTVLGDIPCFRLPHWERRVRRLNAQVDRLSTAAGFPVARIHAAMSAMSWRQHLSNLSADWFHPNERGYAAWAEALWTVIGPRLGGEAGPRRAPFVMV